MEISSFQTDRLLLEPLSMAHSAGMFRLWSQRSVVEFSGEVKDYAGNLIEMPVRESSESDLLIDFWMKAARDQWGFRWAICFQEYPNEFAGILGFNSLGENSEIAFHLHPDYWGKGYMSEAVSEAISWARQKGVNRIDAYIEDKNLASIALVDRFGFVSSSVISEGARKHSLQL